MSGARRPSGSGISNTVRDTAHVCSRELTCVQHVEGDVRWVYPIVDSVVAGITAGDPACVELGVEFIESDHKQPFGRILHARVARALRQQSALLNTDHIARLRARILAMLVAGQYPTIPDSTRNFFGG